MEMTESIKKYKEKIFQGRDSELLETDPEFMERFEALFAEKHLLDEDSYLSKKAEMEQKLDEFAKKYTDIRKKQNIVKKRMVYAYPELKNQFKKYRKKHQKE